MPVLYSFYGHREPSADAGRSGPLNRIRGASGIRLESDSPLADSDEVGTECPGRPHAPPQSVGELPPFSAREGGRHHDSPDLRFGNRLRRHRGPRRGRRADAQGPTFDRPTRRGCRESTSLGPVPGSGGTRGGGTGRHRDDPGGSTGTVGAPRPDRDLDARFGVRDPAHPRGHRPPERAVHRGARCSARWPSPARPRARGQLDGLTLDAAIERLVVENLDLRAQFHEIPKARADILTASLRANPIFYADSQLIPYGNYSKERPGGPIQYDVNISYPLDLSHKRQARTVVAGQATRVLEAQFQDAVRQQIDGLYNTFVGILGARETVRYARASVAGLTPLLDKTRRLQQGGEKTRGDVERVKIQLDSARIGLADAEEALRAAQRPLSPLLRIPLAEAETLEVRGTIVDRAPPPAPVDELIHLAVSTRPDLAAQRLGIGLAEADVKLRRARAVP